MATEWLEGIEIGRGPFVYINKQIPSKVLTLESIPRDIEFILPAFTVKYRKYVCVM